MTAQEGMGGIAGVSGSHAPSPLPTGNDAQDNNKSVSDSLGRDTQAELAKKLGISQSYLSKGLKWARNIWNNPRNNSPVIPDAGSLGNKQTRIHALAKLYRLENYTPLELEAKLGNAGIPYTPQKLNNTYLYHFNINGLQARIATKSLTIWAKEKTLPAGYYALEWGIKEAEVDVERAAQQAGVMLKLTFKSGAIPHQNHIAFMEDEGAVLADSLGDKIEVKDKKDNKVRFLVDKSKGVPEAEFVHSQHALPDSRLYAQAVEDITVNNGWNEMKLLLKDTLELSKFYAENIALHVKILKKLDRKLSQRRLGEW